MQHRQAWACSWRGTGALVLALLAAGPAQPRLPGPDGSDATGQVRPARGRFIVAFEVRADGPEFVWPLDTFPPARHGAVLLVVEEMPRVRTAASAAVWVLPAQRHLLINGRLRHPRRLSPAQERGAGEDEFAVELLEGRLRLSVTLPAGAQPEARHRIARIALYEVEPAGSRRE